MICNGNREIFKLPFNAAERERLSRLKGAARPTFSAFPTRCFVVRDSLFFVFKQCRFDLIKLDIAKTVMSVPHTKRRWIEGILEAIHELLALGIAHLDIRLPNICYDDERNPILIDLDRSVKISYWSVFNICGHYASVMYEITAGVNSENCTLKCSITNNSL